MVIAKHKNKIKENRVFNVVNIIILTILTLLVIVPVWNIVVLSFTRSDVMSSASFSLWPKIFSVQNYVAVFQDNSIYWAFFISIAKTLVGALSHVLVTAMAAYAMSKSYLVFRKIYTAIGIGTMFFSGGMIPTYLLYKNLGLLNNFWVYIIPALFSYFDMIIFMNFFRELPQSIEESACIDGAGVVRIFVQFVIPLSLPVITTIILFNAVGQWNDYMTTLIYINDQSLYPLQMKLYEFIAQQQAAQTIAQSGSGVTVKLTSESVQLATIVIATLPIVIVYPFLQRYFISGMVLGAVKE